MSHLKRLEVPKTWPLTQRKGLTFIARPMPGPHKISDAMTLNHIIIEILHYAKKKKEVRALLNEGNVLINGSVIREPRFPAGLLDIVSIPEKNEYYIVLYNKFGKFYLSSIKKEDAGSIFCRIINKTMLSGKKLQLNFHNGYNLLVAEDTYKVGDTLLIHENKIKKHLKFEKGALVYLTAGKSRGKIGTLEKIERLSGLSRDIVTLQYDNEIIVTIKDYIFVIDKEFTK